jgi:hypothetical protein
MPEAATLRRTLPHEPPEVTVTNPICPAGTQWCLDHLAEVRDACQSGTARFGEVTVWMRQFPGELPHLVYEGTGPLSAFPV